MCRQVRDGHGQSIPIPVIARQRHRHGLALPQAHHRIHVDAADRIRPGRTGVCRPIPKVTRGQPGGVVIGPATCTRVHAPVGQQAGLEAGQLAPEVLTKLAMRPGYAPELDLFDLAVPDMPTAVAVPVSNVEVAVGMTNKSANRSDIHLLAVHIQLQRPRDAVVNRRSIVNAGGKRIRHNHVCRAVGSCESENKTMVCRVAHLIVVGLRPAGHPLGYEIVGVLIRGKIIGVAEPNAKRQTLPESHGTALDAHIVVHAVEYEAGILPQDARRRWRIGDQRIAVSAVGKSVTIGVRIPWIGTYRQLVRVAQPVAVDVRIVAIGNAVAITVEEDRHRDRSCRGQAISITGGQDQHEVIRGAGTNLQGSIEDGQVRFTQELCPPALCKPQNPKMTEVARGNEAFGESRPRPGYLENGATAVLKVQRLERVGSRGKDKGTATLGHAVVAVVIHNHHAVDRHARAIITIGEKGIFPRLGYQKRTGEPGRKLIERAARPERQPARITEVDGFAACCQCR